MSEKRLNDPIYTVPALQANAVEGMTARCDHSSRILALIPTGAQKQVSIGDHVCMDIYAYTFCVSDVWPDLATRFRRVTSI